MVAILAARERLSPPKVPEKKISFILFIYFFFPTKADNGIPFAIPFPKQDKSGVTPKYFCAPPRENLKPVIISSNIKIILFFLNKSCNSLNQSFSGSVKLIGSNIIAAILFLLFFIILCTPSISLNFTAIDKSLIFLGTPKFLGVVPMYQSCQP